MIQIHYHYRDSSNKINQIFKNFKVEIYRFDNKSVQFYILNKKCSIFIF